jgi:hypothetical protein
MAPLPREFTIYTIARGATTVLVTFMGPYTITYLHDYDAPRRTSFPYRY